MEENESEWSEWSDFETDVETMERIADFETSNSVQEPEDNFVHAKTFINMANTCTTTENEYPQQTSTTQKADRMATSPVDENGERVESIVLQKSEENFIPDTHFLNNRVTMASADTDSDLDIPLSVLKRVERCEDSDLELTLAEIKQKQKQTHEFRDLTSPDNYDSDTDFDYKPSTKDINSSDSDSNESYVGHSDDSVSDQIDEIMRKIEINDKKKEIRKELNFSRDKQWKRKGKGIKRKNRKPTVKQRDSELQKKLKTTTQKLKYSRKPIALQTSGNNVSHPNTPNRAFQRALNKSKRDAQVRQIMEKYHTQKLEKLLASNGLRRNTVYPDGNCLINAVSMQLDDTTLTADEMRNNITEHMEVNWEHYSGFMKLNQEMSKDDQKLQFLTKISELRNSGHWESDYSDFVPLCLANMFERPIRIFSSRPFTPVFDIEPDLVDGTGKQKILLAHLAIHGNEHYDAVSKATDGSLNVTASSKATISQLSPARETTPEKSQNEEPHVPVVTPHKPARFVSPAKRHLYRKRQSKPEDWKANKRKRKRAEGLEYTGKTGKCIPARSVKAKDCSKCKFKCSSNITEENRQTLFSCYWNLGDYGKQRSFICTNVLVAEAKMKSSAPNKRSKALSFFFTVEGNKFRVCKDFFLKTLDIGKKTVDIAISKMEHGVFAGRDNRGRKTPGNKTPKEDEQFVHAHIQSFPVIDSHYTRKNTKRKYLSPELNITKMYQLYKEECVRSNKKAVTSSLYRKIFNNQYNLSFFHPKNDQCSTCVIYEGHVSGNSVTPDIEKKYKEHQSRKEEARREKADDKSRANTDKSYHVSTFDLQAVLSVPCSLVGDLYYKRKLSCYNLSFYNLGSGSVQCYLWDESQGGRGSCDIGTCLYYYISSIASGVSPVKTVTLYSDTCGGQNRNQFTAAALHYTLMSLPNLQVINHKFFESGHSQMESDSVHAAIETAKKKTKVYVPSQWETVVNFARRQNPYLVVPMKYSDFKDFKLLAKNQYKNMKVDIRGQRISWSAVKWIQIKKDTPDNIFFNYSFEKDEFLKVNFKSTTRRSGRPVSGEIELQQRYPSKLPISVCKKKDLLSLCTNGIIPESFHEYYKGLPTDAKANDRLPMPDVNESDCETDEN